MAFVATPALLMALLLNRQPMRGLALRWPTWREVGLAAVLSLLLLPPLATLTRKVFLDYPGLTELLQDRQPLVQELHGARFAGGPEEGQFSLPAYLLIFGVVASVCEELAFRGFILSGLLRSFRQRNAILISSFLFALFHMNVFQFLPAFFLGIVLGLLTVRSKSLVPAIIFHMVHNSMLIGAMYMVNAARQADRTFPELIRLLWPGVIAVCVFLGLSLLWWLYRKPYVTRRS
jgi:sodium transport system permease protein